MIFWKKHQIRKHSFQIFSNKWFPWHVLLHKSCMQGTYACFFSTCALRRWFSQCNEIWQYHTIQVCQIPKPALCAFFANQRIAIMARNLYFIFFHSLTGHHLELISSQLSARYIIEILPWESWFDRGPKNAEGWYGLLGNWCFIMKRLFLLRLAR